MKILDRNIIRSLKPKQKLENIPVLGWPSKGRWLKNVIWGVVYFITWVSEGRERMMMMMKASIYGIAIVLLMLASVVPLGTPTEQLSSRECENLGFSGLALCSDCNTFADYVKDKGQSPIPFLYNLLFLPLAQRFSYLDFILTSLIHCFLGPFSRFHFLGLW